MAISALSRPPQCTQVQGRNSAGAIIVPGERLGETVVAVIRSIHPF